MSKFGAWAVQIAGLSVIFVLGLLLIAYDPLVAILLLLIALPLTAIGVIIAVFYLVKAYGEMSVPRPMFFRMLIGTSITKLLTALPVAYIALSGIGNQTKWFALPLFGTQQQRVAVIALAITVLFLPPILYALTIAIARSRASR